MKDQLYRMLLAVYRRLPRRLRRVLVRAGTPKYTVGSICIVRRHDGAVLLVRHSYWGRWGTPGGLAKRHEPPDEAAVRETKEEVGLDVEIVGEPVVVVEPVPHRVDVVFLVRPAPMAALDDVRPTSPEITHVAWFDLSELPPLQPETAAALAALQRVGALDVSGADVTPSSGHRTR